MVEDDGSVTDEVCWQARYLARRGSGDPAAAATDPPVPGPIYARASWELGAGKLGAGKLRPAS